MTGSASLEKANQQNGIDLRRGGGNVFTYEGHYPEFGEGVFVAPTSTVIGRARLGARASVWFNSVVRADINVIEIGEDSNIQDNSVLHVADEHPCIIGDRVVVGHRAMLHGCKVGDECLIGMGAIVLNGAEIGEGSIVAAGTLVTERTKIPPRSVVMGTPGRVIKPVTDAQLEMTIHTAKKYGRVAANYLRELSGME